MKLLWDNSDPPLGAASRVPVTDGHLGIIQAGLMKRCTGRPSGLSSTPSTVSAFTGGASRSGSNIA